MRRDNLRRRRFNRNNTDVRRPRNRRFRRRYRTYNSFGEKEDKEISQIITRDQMLSKTRLHIRNLHPTITNEELKVK